MRRRPSSSSSSSSSSGRFKRFRFWVVLSVCVRLRRVVVAVRLRCLSSSHAPDRQGVGILLAKMRRRRLNRRRRVLVLMFVLVDPGHPYTSSESSSGDESDTQSNRLDFLKVETFFFVFFVFFIIFVASSKSSLLIVDAHQDARQKNKQLFEKKEERCDKKN